MDREAILMKIGLKIRELRNGQNLSIMELSDKLEIEYNNLIRIEKGRTNFTIGTLLKVCKALNVKLIDIVNVE
ncbi:MAG: helix-turn-helix domain-containing protein [Prevotellaceae bacterium]|jgi:transcriptional regulator with XRE-family HTH domain|nr:helix-turn-helix domain-containing protein [Prevotellaceae bacterium]